MENIDRLFIALMFAAIIVVSLLIANMVSSHATRLTVIETKIEACK